MLPAFFRTWLPECDPESKQVIHPCKEMRHDAIKACSNITSIALPKSRRLQTERK